MKPRDYYNQRPEPKGKLKSYVRQAVSLLEGGIPEIVIHEHNGLLVGYDDDKALCKAMERALTDKQL